MSRVQSIKQVAWTMAVVAISYLLSSCTLLTPIKSDSSEALINELPTELPQHTTHAATLLVLKPQASPIIDTPQIAYTTSQYHVDYFNKQRWAATPPQMLLPLLTTTLERTGYFSYVFTPPYFGNYDYALGSEIRSLTQDYTTQPAVLKLSIKVQLTSGVSGQLIAGRVIEIREPLRQDNSSSGVVAANDAMAKALQEIAGFVLAGVEQRRY